MGEFLNGPSQRNRRISIQAGIVGPAIVLGVAFFVGNATPLRAETPQVISMKLAGEKEIERHGHHNSQWLLPLTECREPEIQWPQFASAKPVFYAAVYGDAKDNVFSFAIDESAGTETGYNIVYIDGNNDNRIDPDTERFPIQLATRFESPSLRIRLMNTAGGVTSPYFVDLSAFYYQDRRHPDKKVHANLRRGSYYLGEADFGGKRHLVAILDMNGNGKFNDYGESYAKRDQLLIDLDDDGEFRGHDDPTRNESFPYCRYTRVDGAWYSIAASVDGSQLTVARVEPAMGVVEFPPYVTRAKLRSPTQLLELQLIDGKAEAIVGRYELLSYRIEVSGGSEWGLDAFRFKKTQEVAIVKGEVTKTSAGANLRVEAVVEGKDEAREISVGLRFTDNQDTDYRIFGGGETVARPAVVVLDPQQRPVAAWHPSGAMGPFRDSDGVLIPRNFHGKYEIWPVVNLPNMEYKTVGAQVEFKNGHYVAP